MTAASSRPDALARAADASPRGYGARALDVIGRLGGALVVPHRTLPAVLAQGRGSIFEVLLLALVAAVVVSPTSAGQAVLLLRANVGDGALMIVQLVVGRFSYALIGVLVAAALLTLVDRARDGAAAVGFDRALDACAYALVPYFVLAIAGATLAASGLELSFLPHRTLRGRGLDWLSMVAAGYAWSVATYGVLLWRVTRVPRTEDTSS